LLAIGLSCAALCAPFSTRSESESVPATASTRIEAQSHTFRAVGVLDGERMSIRVSRILDDAPVNDALLSVTVRSKTEAAVAQTDGSYQVRMPELALPGESVVAINVIEGPGPRGAVTEKLVGTLSAPQATKPNGPVSRTRQFMWWVLNFGVCIALLLLISRRKKASGEDD
jgi:hypothetical protein